MSADRGGSAEGTAVDVVGVQCATHPAEAGLQQPHQAPLATDDVLAADPDRGRRAQALVVGVTLLPVRRCPAADEVHRPRVQLEDSVTVVPLAASAVRTVRGGNQDVAVVGLHRPRRAPHPGLAGVWYGVERDLALAVGRCRRRVADVVAAVAGMRAVRHDHPVVDHQERGALLFGVLVAGLVDVDAAVPPTVAVLGVQGPQGVPSAPGRCHDEHRAGLRVVRRAAGDADRVDVAAWLLAQRLGCPEVGPPDPLTGGGVESVDLVVLGGGNEDAVGENRLAPHAAVQLCGPVVMQLACDRAARVSRLARRAVVVRPVGVVRPAGTSGGRERAGVGLSDREVTRSARRGTTSGQRDGQDKGGSQTAHEGSVPLDAAVDAITHYSG